MLLSIPVNYQHRQFHNDPVCTFLCVGHILCLAHIRIYQKGLPRLFNRLKTYSADRRDGCSHVRPQDCECCDVLNERPPFNSHSDLAPARSSPSLLKSRLGDWQKLYFDKDDGMRLQLQRQCRSILLLGFYLAFSAERYSLSDHEFSFRSEELSIAHNAYYPTAWSGSRADYLLFPSTVSSVNTEHYSEASLVSIFCRWLYYFQGTSNPFVRSSCLYLSFRSRTPM